uniref:Glutamyl-tRNA(Gln) amidotransferase subunit E n=1 Tax=uncultured marine thaumarchaeote KM3_74_C10 TaxID=1456270 RepID=A0A075HKS8_9ARCH|nr:glutamyl-tRNA(Gln) amidotransferase subunit E (gatE) [uncultured marine thaumarchaeote KM3_74_C10]
MKSYDSKDLGVKVGLEIHQQLGTQHKLFCKCQTLQTAESSPSNLFNRRLRPSRSEIGEIDPAARFEFSKNRTIKYHGRLDSVCLVEADEEPPRSLNEEALEIGLLVALSLGSHIVDEIHIMRKIVIDGSNTGGFQRTVLIARGGELKIGRRSIKIQDISIEEDAARLLNESDDLREFELDRLGTPLIEVSTAPMSCTPEEVKDVALAIGRLLRSTKRVARGIGTIRQDVNISVAGGPVVEVKGVQQIELIEKILNYEVSRQLALKKLVNELAQRGITELKLGPIINLTNCFHSTNSALIKKLLGNSKEIKGIGVSRFKGLFNFESESGFRLGRELAEMARFHGLGGIFHSDELPQYGISEQEVQTIRRTLHTEELDAFFLAAGDPKVLVFALNALQERLRLAVLGAPAETRATTPDGTTKYMRPKPGAARMYPETDLPPIEIQQTLLSKLKRSVPQPWEKQLADYSSRYGLSQTQAEKIFDSEDVSLFEEIVRLTAIAPSIVAATITETMKDLSRRGLNMERLSSAIIRELFLSLDNGLFAKEAISEILAAIGNGKATNIEEAISLLQLHQLETDELQQILEDIFSKNIGIVQNKREGAFSILMGMIMAKSRGRADGALISTLLKNKLTEFLATSDQAT